MKNMILNILAVILLISCGDKKESYIEPDNQGNLTIKGAWEVTHIIKKNTDTAIVQIPWHKSIYIYTDRYFSIAAATEERPSMPVLEKGEKIDPDYFKKVYLRYISNSGTYKIVGDSLIHNVIVAKSPTVMNKKRRSSQHITLEKDKMLFTSAKSNVTTTLTLERLKE